jgi:hypothetical protein
MTTRHLVTHALVFAFGIGLAYAASLRRSRPSPGTLGVGSEIEVTQPGGWTTSGGEKQREKKRTRLEVRRVGPAAAGGAPLGQDVWTLEVGGVRCAAVPVE